MTLPNKLTLLRIFSVFALIIVSVIPCFNNNFIGNTALSVANLINVIIFVVASLTDFLDGYLARKNNQVTTFGKFADPLADKILVISALVILMANYYQYSGFNAVIPAWTICIILIREFMVSGIRLVAVEREGKVISAGWSGKVKTAFTMVTIIACFLSGLFMQQWYLILCQVLLYISVFLTIYSGTVYLIKNKSIIFESI